MDDNTRLTNTKKQWAMARWGGEEREVFYEGDDRLPPGQHLDLVKTFPVLDLGFKPAQIQNQQFININPTCSRRVPFTTKIT